MFICLHNICFHGFSCVFIFVHLCSVMLLYLHRITSTVIPPAISRPWSITYSDLWPFHTLPTLPAPGGCLHLYQVPFLPRQMICRSFLVPSYFGDISVRLFRRMPLESAVEGVSVRRQGAKPARERESYVVVVFSCIFLYFWYVCTFLHMSIYFICYCYSRHTSTKYKWHILIWFVLIGSKAIYVTQDHPIISQSWW